MAQADYHPMPWKNGLGETLEIACMRDEKGILFRISQASVTEDGLFSDFSGLQRTLVLLSGRGMHLVHTGKDGRTIEQSLNAELDIARFSGGDRTCATLPGGPIEDFNIMVREGSIKARVQTITDNEPFVSGADSLWCGFYARETSLLLIEPENHEIDKPGQKQIEVPGGDTLVFTTPVNISRLSGRGIAIAISPV